MLRSVSRTAQAAQRLVGTRTFTAFTGQDQHLFIGGKAVAETASGKSDIDLGFAFVVRPSQGVIQAQYIAGDAGAVAPEMDTEMYLINKDGTSGKVRMFTNDDEGASSIKATGPAFKWTAMKTSVVTPTGEKKETDFTFTDKNVPVKVVTTGKDGKVAATVSGTLPVISQSQFNDLYMTVRRQLEYRGGLKLQEETIKEAQVKAEEERARIEELNKSVAATKARKQN